jgi:hypothetical protein
MSLQTDSLTLAVQSAGATPRLQVPPIDCSVAPTQGGAGYDCGGALRAMLSVQMRRDRPCRAGDGVGGGHQCQRHRGGHRHGGGHRHRGRIGIERRARPGRLGRRRLGGCHGDGDRGARAGGRPDHGAASAPDPHQRGGVRRAHHGRDAGDGLTASGTADFTLTSDGLQAQLDVSGRDSVRPYLTAIDGPTGDAAAMTYRTPLCIVAPGVL